MRPLLLLLAFAQLQAGRPGVSAQRSETRLGVRARAAADSFVAIWRYHWETGQLIQRRLPDAIAAPPGYPPIVLGVYQADSVAIWWERDAPESDLRHNLIHCHPDGAVSPRGKIANPNWKPGDPGHPAVIDSYGGWRRLEEYIIESGVGKRAICPSWYQGGERPVWDERLSLDAGIALPLQAPVRTARARLLALLDSAARETPADDWLAGQRVRFTVDQGAFADARRAADECRATRWWCVALAGYVAYADAQPLLADSLFEASTGLMAEAERCAWTDLRLLVDSTVAYSSIPCSKRLAIDERIWWLSDPLFTEPGNERRAEHFARVVLARLRSGTETSERWDLRDAGGGNAIRQMLVRYGWPSFSVWGGPEEDRSHLSYLNGGSAQFERFATAEYAAPRVHTVPSWTAIQDPWSAADTDWVLTKRASAVVAPLDTLWWPREHFSRRGGPMAQLWGQLAAFRRDTAILFAFASDLDPAVVGHAAGESMSGALVFSTAPDSMTTIPVSAKAGGIAVFSANVASHPSVAGVELRGTSAEGMVARARFGFLPPAPLAAMRDGDVAISMPVFVAPPPTGAIPITAPGAALARMLGSTTFYGVKRVGVYWESYGINPGDTADVSVRIERLRDAPNLFQRIAMRLGLARKTTGGVSVAWQEPSPERVVTTIPGRIPVQGRSVTIDLGLLQPGDYMLIVDVSRRGKDRASASRPFRLALP